MAALSHSEIIKRMETAYDGAGFELQRVVWGGENMHMGIFADAAESLPKAMERANERMLAPLHLDPSQHALEVACGFGGVSVALARRFGCRVTTTDISEANVNRALERAKAAGLGDRVAGRKADFHQLPFEDSSFDLWWCQDSMLIAADREQVMREARRVLKPGGQLVVSDVVARRSTPEQARAHLMTFHPQDLWAAEDYRDSAERLGFVLREYEYIPESIPLTYSGVLKVYDDKRAEIAALIGEQRIQGATGRYKHWLEGGREGWIGWFHMRAELPR